MSFDRILGGSASAAVLTLAIAAATPAHADPTNLVTNGNFANATNLNTNINSTSLPGWSLTNCASSSPCGFQFVVNPAGLATNGWYDAVDQHQSYVYSTPGNAPDGNANAFMSDANYQTQALYQAIGNLKIGDTYTLSFYQASLQQTGYQGAAQNSWQVGLGNGSTYDVRQSDTMNNAAHGNTPWVKETMSFVANATSEILYFLATTSNGAQPPFLLLDGVSFADTTVSVPEPATIALAGLGFVGLVAARRRRKA